VFPYRLAAAMQAAATHLELGVATRSNKIANTLALYFCAASLFYSYWIVRESWLWHALSRLDLFFFRDTFLKRKTNIFSQAFQNEKILHHEGVGEYPSWISL
jgi:hypothetical protein